MWECVICKHWNPDYAIDCQVCFQRSTKMRLKARKRPSDAKLTKVMVYDATNDDIVATWLRLPSYVQECPIFSCCADCRKCWK